ncbi:hypothetical protein B0H19DRAFT_1258798 [Mycena capillaripes]|nr:hypothetical protein B0H19DRAFT_1258798 [Mycena capillaripes]
MAHDQAKKLTALAEYLELMGISDIKELPYGSGSPPVDDVEYLASSVAFETNCESWNKYPDSGNKNAPITASLLHSTTQAAPIHSYLLKSYHSHLIEPFTMPVFSRIIPPQEIDRKWANWNAGHVVVRRQTDDTFAACVNGNWTLVSAKNVLLYIIWNARLYREAAAPVGPGPLGYEIWVAPLNRLEPQGAPWARFDANLGRNVFPAPRGSEIATPLIWLLRAPDMGEVYRAPAGMRLISEKMYLHYLEGTAYREEKRVSAQNERRGKKLEQDDAEFDFVTPGFTNRRAEEEALAENEVEVPDEQEHAVPLIEPPPKRKDAAKKNSSRKKQKGGASEGGAGAEGEDDLMEQDVVA